MAPNVNNPVRWAWWPGIEWLLKLRFADKSKNVGGVCSSVRYIAHLYCLRVLDFCAGGPGFDPQPGQKVISIFYHLLH